ncbi:hypothetical protein HA402_008401 [Bradysia odoriphaga]|nr:hypothetical protein HA402_008401 [Bradysia odoriphaga]
MLSYLQNISERPITQHGLSGLPTAHGTANRLIKDKRYWQAQLQMKMNEITRETDKLNRERQIMDRERSAKRSFEKKVKEATKELTNLQSKLTDMNIVLDSHSSGTTRQQIQQEAIAIRERNENIQSQLEMLFNERQSKEDKNKELERKINEEKAKINEMIFALSPADQERYRQHEKQLESLRAQNSEIHDQIDSLIKQKQRMEATLSTSQTRMEAARLLTKLNELVAKRNNLREEEANRLTPAQEREKLIVEVRANNQALTSMNKQMKQIEDQLSDKKETLQQIEQDLEESNSERHVKYMELKRRDETMSAFMATFRASMEEEQNNIDTLKNQITYAIEQITLQGINLKNYGITKSSILNEKNDLSSQEGLLKEYKKLSIQLKQLQILEKRTKDQKNEMNAEEALVNEEIVKFSNLDVLRDEAAAKMEEMAAKLEELKKKERVTESVVQEARKRNAEIKEKLRSNENYRQISHLEEKLTDLIKENKILEESLLQTKKEFDYSELKRQAEENLNYVLEAIRNESVGF